MADNEDGEEQRYSSTPKELNDDETQLLNQQNSRLVSPFQSRKLEIDAKKHWDIFYKRNENRFFKDRHWIMREFPELEDVKSSKEPRTLLEVGCGVGNLFYPLLEEGLPLTVYACDLSPRAIDLVKQRPLYDVGAINAFQMDVTVPDCFSNITRNVDIATLIFVLSAVHPDKFASVLRNVFNTLKPGGVLFFRDYGLYDMAQIRFKPGHKIGDNFYMRQDGTRSYFFSTDEIHHLFSEIGFNVISNHFVHRRTINKKEDVNVPRIYVQAKVQKPI